MTVKISDIAPDGSVFAVEVSGPLGVSDVEQYLGRFSSALAAGRVFGVLVSYVGAAPRKPRDAHLLETTWLARHRSQMSEHCVGMALVSNGRLLAALSKIAMKGLGNRILGCPCNAFSNEAAARHWLEAQRSRLAHPDGRANL